MSQSDKRQAERSEQQRSEQSAVPEELRAGTAQAAAEEEEAFSGGDVSEGDGPAVDVRTGVLPQSYWANYCGDGRLRSSSEEEAHP